MKIPLEMVNRARMPTSALAALASLRRVAGISVVQVEDASWVSWEAGDDRVIRTVIPIEGIELFEERGDRWFHPGRSLPSFEMPPNLPPIGLARAVTPSLFLSEAVSIGELDPAGLELIADGHPRTTTATSCTLSQLAEWADRATSAEIGCIRAAISDDLALLLGPHLPIWPGAARYWGTKLLVPLGFQPWPCLPEGIIREVLGASEGDLVRLEVTGSGLSAELIPLRSFRPMTRAGVRLATRGQRHES